MMAELPFPEGYYVYDKSDMKKALDQFPSQVRDALKTPVPTVQKADIIYYFGMGGSGICGDLLRTYLFKKAVEIHVVRGYEIPEGIPKDALLIFSSYSGNTEEVLTCYKAAQHSFKNAITLSSGGKLAELARINKTPHILLPRGFQPRSTIAFQFFPLLNTFAKAGMTIFPQDEVDDLLKQIDMKELARTSADLCLKFKDAIPLVYASERYGAIAYRWKTQFNENTKLMAFSHEIPEMNHNELVGYTFIRGRFSAVILRFDDDHRRIQKRMDLMKAIIKRAGVEVTEVAVKGKLLSKMFTAILIGDYTAYYLALRYKIDPSPVKLIEKFKDDLGPFV